MNGGGIRQSFGKRSSGACPTHICDVIEAGVGSVSEARVMPSM
jgi:hypothetical protein